MADTATSLTDAQIDELLKQAEVRLLEKQQAQQNKSVVAIRPTNNEIADNNNAATETPASIPAASVPGSQKGRQLSVRVPEARKSKKEMVRFPYRHLVPLYCFVMKSYPNSIDARTTPVMGNVLATE